MRVMWKASVSSYSGGTKLMVSIVAIAALSCTIGYTIEIIPTDFNWLVVMDVTGVPYPGNISMLIRFYNR